MTTVNHITETYWKDLNINENDLDFIFNLLLEKEIPLSTKSLIEKLIENRIRIEKANIKNKISKEKTYFPKGTYHIGELVKFPALEMQMGEVVAIRDGVNPDFSTLKVIDLKMENGENKSFASEILDHALNEVVEIDEDDPLFDPSYIYDRFGKNISETLEASLHTNEDLVKIAGNWFPRSLLVDVNIGHLNLAEAILEEANGGPISTIDLMNQVELNANADKKLLEFSFDLSLQEDNRFDEVGPSGETLWFLHSMAPESVKETPIFLKYSYPDYKKDDLEKYMLLFEDTVFDELEEFVISDGSKNKFVISLTFPHWKAGTLPLTESLKKLFPTAYEAPRIKFSFFDKYHKEYFPGWVVRPHKYIFGLHEWYENNEIMPGSLISVEKGKKPGEITISYAKSRQNREWLKTVLIGTDGGVVFAMLKHPINADFNQRMAVTIPDPDAVNSLWENKTFIKEPFEKTILRTMRELAKLNPQGQVHGQELYAATNVIRRCPPSLVIRTLLDSPSIKYLGDLYFIFNDKE